MNETEVDKQQWDENWVCPECKQLRLSDDSGCGRGVDPCLGKLPGVKAACCGHGGKGNCGGYIYFTNGVTIRFEKCIVDYR